MREKGQIPEARLDFERGISLIGCARLVSSENRTAHIRRIFAERGHYPANTEFGLIPAKMTRAVDEALLGEATLMKPLMNQERRGGRRLQAPGRNVEEDLPPTITTCLSLTSRHKSQSPARRFGEYNETMQPQPGR